MKTTSLCLPVSLSPCLFLGAGVGVAAAIGCVAAKLNAAGFAPIGLLPLVAGVVLGLAVSRMAMVLHVACTTQLVIGTLVFALVTVAFEHAWLYRDFRREWIEARAANPQVALFRSEMPWSLGEYTDHEWTRRRAVLWCADAAILVASAMTAVFIANRHASQSTSLTDQLNPEP